MDVTSKRKKNCSCNSEGSVKFVGINHGACLHLFLLMDAWKKEQFTDVTFFCQNAPDDNKKHHNLKRKLCANRSVLAAASPFFATLLPDQELEVDVCISINVDFNEMFCILEYIYSGKLLCPATSKDRILSIMEEFRIFVPENVKKSKLIEEEEKEDEVEIIIEEAVESEFTSQEMNQEVQNNLNDDSFHDQVMSNAEETCSNTEQTVTLPPSKLSRSPQKLPSSPQKVTGKPSRTPKICNKKNNAHTALSASVPSSNSKGSKNINNTRALENQTKNSINRAQTIALKSQNVVEKRPIAITKPKDHSVFEVPAVTSTIAEDGLTLKGQPDKDAVTLQLPNHFFGGSSSEGKELENNQIKLVDRGPSSYTLPLYHSHTWCYGIYTPMEPDAVYFETPKPPDHLMTNKDPTVIHDWTVFRAPTFLTSWPKRFYRRQKVVGTEGLKRKLPDVDQMEIETKKSHNGKTHVTLKGEAMAKINIPQLFHTTDVTIVREIRRAPVDFNYSTNDDKIDLAKAKHYLNEEVTKRKLLQRKIRRFTDILNKQKKLARTILRKSRALEAKKREMEAARLLQGTKKFCPKAPCKICGKMISTACMSDHLKIHSGVKSHLCDHCGRAFVLKSYLNAHIRVNHRGADRPKRFMCSTCGHTCDSKHRLEVHERVHTNEKPYPCEYCDRRFREKGTLVRHIRTHTGEKPYECNICGTAYAARDTYVGHYRRMHEKKRSEGAGDVTAKGRHTNTVVYRCDFCEKEFHRILAYEKHRVTHTGGEVAIRCTQGNCDFTYSEMLQLKEHMAACHPEKTYTCGLCSKVFLTKQNLMNHQSKHDPNLGFHCSYCSLSLTTKASLLVHEKIHTRETPHECTFCGSRFHSPYLLKIHLRKHQPNESRRRRGKRSVAVESEVVLGNEVELEAEVALEKLTDSLESC